MDKIFQIPGAATYDDIPAMLRRAEQLERKAKDTPPCPRPHKDRYERLMGLTMIREMAARQPASYQTCNTFVTANKHSSKVSDWRTLQPIVLKDMMGNKVHYGRYLLCRFITGFYCTSALTTVIEDENGDVEDISIYNYQRDFKHLPTDILPMGTVIVIKEPFLKMALSAKGFMIRVDSPSDIVIIEDKILESRFCAEDFIPDITFDKWKTEGNRFFLGQKYYMAIRSYEQALKMRKCPVVYSNIAAAYLSLEFFWQAFQSAEQSLKLMIRDSSTKDEMVKVNLRKGKAAYGMRQWKLAVECFEECLKLNPKNQPAKLELARATERLHEATTGEISLDKLYEESESGKIFMDVADYVDHEKIMVKYLGPEKEKGVVAKTFIKKGTLLVVSKAFSMGCENESYNTGRVIIQYNMVNKTADFQSQVQNMGELVFKVHSNPYLAREFYCLQGGPGFNRDERLDDTIVDTARLEAICTLNSFSAENIFKEIVSSEESTEKIQKLLKKSSGLWIFPSYFNHSCVPNTNRVFFGDVMVISASKDIQKDEELFVSYESSLASYSERQKKFKAYNFQCTCPLCLLDSRDQTVARREKFFEKNYEKLREGVENEKFNEKQVEELVEKVRETYKDRTEYQIDLFHPLTLLSNTYLKRSKFKEAAETFMKIYHLIKDFCASLATLNAIAAYNAYRKCNMPNDACACMNLAVQSHCLGDELFFFKYYAKCIQD